MLQAEQTSPFEKDRGEGFDIGDGDYIDPGDNIEQTEGGPSAL
jgi:hypothetical protein